MDELALQVLDGLEKQEAVEDEAVRIVDAVNDAPGRRQSSLCR